MPGGRSFRLGEKNQKPPGASYLCVRRLGPGPPLPTWGCGSGGFYPPASSRGRAGSRWLFWRRWVPLARQWLALCARVCVLVCTVGERKGNCMSRTLAQRGAASLCNRRLRRVRDASTLSGLGREDARQSSTVTLLRRGASVMRRDPRKGKTHSALAKWVSKGLKALRRGVQRGQSPLWRLNTQTQ
jgi:hypothetical protein